MSSLNENIFELTLPIYLKNDIRDLEAGRKDNAPLLDCLYCEVQASINSAFYNKDITKAEADFLRRKYLGLEGS